MILRLLLIIIFTLIPLLGACRPSPSAVIGHPAALGRQPRIEPDFTGITIPPNIAPLDFRLLEPCRSYRAEFSSKNCLPIVVSGSGSAVRIPPGKWRKLLEANKGEPLHITLYFQDSSGRWLAAKTIEDSIAAAPVDRFVTYRLLSFGYNYWTDIRLCERDLESFRERVFLNNANFSRGCCNCHTPRNNDPGSFTVQSRSSEFGSSTLIAHNGRIQTISSHLGYTAWHPGGRFIAFSVYKVEQFFHAVGRNIIDQYDNNASIVIYNTAKNALDPVPALVDQRFLQTWPAWSPDGRWLYFCRAPVLWTDFTKSPPDNYDKVKYSLCRIFYNEADNSWGAVDTLLSTGETGLSISQPRISPDNRFLLFCMHDRGVYPHTRQSSDLYMMDLGSRKIRRLDFNSEYSESWHGWSSNGRWILFSSKRGGGIFTRLYFSYVDSSGCAHKPFILPQEDPLFYQSFIKCCNVPEFAVAQVKFDQRDFLRAIRSCAKIPVPVPATGAAAQAGQNPHIQ
jgi:hypothetical protein